MKNQLFKAIGIVTIINIVARLIGFAKDAVVGMLFSKTEADAIFFAYTIPNLIYLVVGGAITTAFISIYSKLPTKEEKTKFLNIVFSYMTVIFIALTILLMIFVDPILKLSFRQLSSESFEITKNLYLWMTPSTVLLVLSIWLSGVLNVHNRFSLSTFSTLLYNLVFLIFGVALVPILSFYSYGFGALLGAVFMILVLIYGIKKEKIQFRFQFAYTNEMKRLVNMTVPLILGGAALQFYIFIQRIYAARFPEFDGLTTLLNNASKLTQFPQAVLMTAVTTVIYPLLSKKVAANEMDQIESLYQRGLRVLRLMLLPITVFVYFYAQDIVTIVFEYGKLTADDTILTAPLVQILAISMYALASSAYVTRFFYAMENTFLPVLINVISVFGVTVLATNILIDYEGTNAIAWGTTISAISNYILLVMFGRFILRLKVYEKDMKQLGKTWLFILVLGTVTYVSSLLLSFASSFFNVAMGLVIFVIVGALLMKLLKFPELEIFTRYLRSKRNKQVAE
ncbi:murein biosynthesis integral membrane protein MurJ [Cytobacillus sp. IB215665]|uniref:murein biosynthesis integral membrane protein MurJ n=1 Tax=Cytobacillus sp. IB215665 TaxID=3097357 RepID=UPI002A0EE017|nr:lipid II flippase MurJ [Cytobacillus sp. IB215665]MDX8363802.1 lipid II flippase MurJ [Cytobacillus sp. IB215665]